MSDDKKPVQPPPVPKPAPEPPRTYKGSVDKESARINYPKK
jgi:hypothetical protein